MYDYLIVGSESLGSVFAHEAKAHGKSVFVLKSCAYAGGDTYCERSDDIKVYKYDVYIFHTSYE